MSPSSNCAVGEGSSLGVSPLVACAWCRPTLVGLLPPESPGHSLKTGHFLLACQPPLHPGHPLHRRHPCTPATPALQTPLRPSHPLCPGRALASLATRAQNQSHVSLSAHDYGTPTQTSPPGNSSQDNDTFQRCQLSHQSQEDPEEGRCQDRKTQSRRLSHTSRDLFSCECTLNLFC